MHLHKLYGMAVLLGVASCGTEDGQAVRIEPQPPQVEWQAQNLQFQDEFGVERARFIGANEDGTQRLLAPEDMQGIRTWIPQEEMDARAAERQRTGQPVNVVSEHAHNTDIVLREAAAMAPDQPITVTALLEEPPVPAFDFTRFERLDEEPAFAGDNFDAVSNAIITERQDSLRPSQTAFTEAAERLGAIDIAPFWIINGVTLTIPSRNVVALARLPGVAGLTPTRSTKPATHDPNLELGYDAQETIDGMRMRNIKANGFDGLSGGRTGGRMKIAVIEPELGGAGWTECIDADHPAFKDWVNGPTRIIRNWLCDDVDCASSNCSATEDYEFHGTSITGLIAGDSTAQNQVWFAHNAHIYYYRATGMSSASVAQAFQHAIADGVDIINYSAFFPQDPLFDDGGDCDMLRDVSGMNGILRNALAAGVVTVVAANGFGVANPPVGTCTMNYPATRPEALSAPHFNSTCVHDVPGPSPNYDTLSMESFEPRGGGTITVNGFAHDYEVRILDVGTPGELVTHQPITNNIWNTNGCYSGSGSFSAAILSGAMTLMRQTYWWKGWNTSRIVTGDAMLQADGWDWDTGQVRSWSGSRKSGYGRGKFHWPSDADNHLVSPWGWGGNSFNLAQGQLVCHTVGGAGAESVDITQLTATMMWFETNYGNAADVVLEIVDDCTPCAGAPGVLIERDVTYDNSKRIRLTGGFIGGKCLVMETKAFHVPGGGTVAIERADRWSSGDPNDF